MRSDSATFADGNVAPHFYNIRRTRQAQNIGSGLQRRSYSTFFGLFIGSGTQITAFKRNYVKKKT